VRNRKPKATVKTPVVRAEDKLVRASPIQEVEELKMTASGDNLADIDN
jgi:hypothetical protein